MIKIESKKTAAGWIGTGTMGLHMCRHIMEKGFKTAVYTRTKSKAQELIDKGALWAETPKELALISDVIFTMVGFPEDVRQVYMGTNGIFEGAKKGSILIDMTTTLPSLALEIYEKAQKKGIHAVDAPVSGGDVGARNAALSIMAGGDKEVIQNIMPLFETMGKKIVYQGGPGTGQHTKMCNQIMIAGTMIGMCESLLYGYRAGLDMEVMLSSISGGAAACWALDNLAPRILNHEFDTGFFVEHFVKDMGIALQEADKMNISLPGLALVNQLYKSVVANKGKRLGTQALMLTLEKMSNLEFS
ncbi:Piutative 2-hydroxy-3-oxopropionate reductase [Desulfonema limicola]|uniref:Piutative 2-hydroxy-3-oxopropionate reductase n=1 Tax=Desulfonema limicola TaxID=45656 RepID=A0A975B6D6_9BACT|nr:NAD(P)-dependent oxidoreductase [Desulfonema limicola]QTA79612.1 Piutative 2-hydroxy-3-oxopropionate reductase [Desulfonema limicola]